MLKRIYVSAVASIVLTFFVLLNLNAVEMKSAGAAVETVLATVEGVPISKDALYLRIVQLYPTQAQDALDRMVNEILISKEAERKKVTVTDADIIKKAQELGIAGALNDAAKGMIRSSLQADRLITDEFKIKVTQEEVKAFFDANKVQLGDPEQVRLSQIFVATEQEANDIMLSLNAGADFSKMAKAKSMDAASKDKGGDIGFFARGMILPEIEKAAFDMKTGEITQPIKSTTGFHIIKVTDKKPAKEAKFDSNARQRIELGLKNLKIQQQLPAWLDGLRKKAEIK